MKKNGVGVVDAVMGSGKTSAIINWMNARPDRKFIFATQYIDECCRIRDACPKLCFRLPQSDDGTKSTDVLRLISGGDNIALSHSLLSRFTDDMLDVLRGQNYVLIMDEVFDVMHTVDVTEADKQLLMDSGSIQGDELTGSMSWTRDNYYKDSKFYDLKQRMDLGGVVESEDRKMMEWMYRPDMFEEFDEVYLLTYMFDWSPMRFYFEIVGIPYFFIGVRKDEHDEYTLCRVDEMPPANLDIRSKIHLIDNPKRNELGNPYYALSKHWYKDGTKMRDDHTALMRGAMRKLQQAEWDGVPASDIMWSTFSDDIRSAVVSEIVNGKRRHRFSGTFVEFSCRAKNAFGHKHHLAYLVNVFLPSALSIMLSNHGISTTRELKDGYATSVMVQWIWRSAIRNGEEIWLYMPSRRMRELLNKWIDQVSS